MFGVSNSAGGPPGHEKTRRELRLPPGQFVGPSALDLGRSRAVGPLHHVLPSKGKTVSTYIVPVTKTIGNADGPARDFARTGPVSATSDHTAGGPIGLPGANGEPVSGPAPLPPPPGGPAAGFLTANGSRDSHAVILADGHRNRSPRAGKPYGRISWRGIRELVEEPGAVEKDSAPLVILSTYAEHDGRTHDVQRARGVFAGLAVDIDKGDPSLEDVVDALRQAVGPVAAMVYSSSSAEPGNRKWRILLPLAEPIAGADYHDVQEGLFALLADRGIVCDPTLARPAQPVYLPNVPPHRRGADGRPKFYAWRILQGQRLELVPGSPLLAARDVVRATRAAEEAAAAEAAERNERERAAYVASTGDRFDPVEDYNRSHRVEECLQRYGFKRRTTGRGSHWSSPISTSKSFSTEDRGDHWVCVSAWAREHNVGRESRGGSAWYGSAFDLFAHFEHGGDRRAAVLAYVAQARPDLHAEFQRNAKRRDAFLEWASGNRRAPPPARSLAVRVEPPEPVVEELVELEQYRRDIAQAVADVVLDGRPGIKLLRGEPGTGKTHAVAKAVAKYPRGVVSVPGHDLAAEVVEKLRAAGADAAAYPRLDESSCGNYATAARAQAAGLSAPATVCPRCPLLDACRESGYIARLGEAEQASHKVVTHARLVRSAARLTKKAEYVVLEEDPSAALAPMVSAGRRQLERLGALADLHAAASERALITMGADLIAGVEPVAEFLAWAPDEAESREPGAEPASTNTEAGNATKTPTPDARRHYPRGFFGSLCRVADELAAGAARALAGELPDGVHELHVEPVRNLPKNPEGDVWAALDAIEAFDPDATAGIGADAMQLAVSVATGRLERVLVQVETDARPGAGRRRVAEIVGQWRTKLPVDRVPVFVNDGTLEADTLRRIAPGEVEDITPTGRTPLLHYAAHYPHDVLPTTSSARVAAMIAGIARQHEDKPRLGLIMHQRHYRELIEADDSPLPPDVRQRVAWATYYGSGADRGTNTLHRVADLAIVIGTHRPPPSEIRRTLVRWGELEAAAAGSTWGRIDRQGTDHTGQAVEYHGRGYAETAWAKAADATIRATMRQAVGRARAIAPDGVAVVAVTTERVGLPVLDPATLPEARPHVDELVAALAEATGQGVKIGSLSTENRAKNPRESIRVSCAILPRGPVPIEELETRLPGVSRRSLQLWLREAIEAGLVERTGEARATRYALAGSVATPAPAPAPRRLSLAPVPVADSTRSVTIAVGSTLTTIPTQPPQRPPVVVEERPPRPDWLGDVLAPERHDDERLLAEFFMAGPYARSVGLEAAWESEIAPPLVVKLCRVAMSEAKRRGQPPPPIDVVAGHTVAWYAVAAQAG